MIEHGLATPRIRCSRRCKMAAIFLHLQFQLELLQVARTNAVRKAQIGTAVSGFAPGGKPPPPNGNSLCNDTIINSEHFMRERRQFVHKTFALIREKMKRSHRLRTAGAQLGDCLRLTTAIICRSVPPMRRIPSVKSGASNRDAHWASSRICPSCLSTLLPRLETMARSNARRHRKAVRNTRILFVVKIPSFPIGRGNQRRRFPKSRTERRPGLAVRSEQIG